MFKSFYIHRHCGSIKLPRHSKPRGFTLKVDHDPANPRNAIVRGSWCSAEDHFDRKIGRATADSAEPHSINKRMIPELLASMENSTSIPKATSQAHAFDKDYYYVLKYVV